MGKDEGGSENLIGILEFFNCKRRMRQSVPFRQQGV
jgi:hypothetical protein